MSTKRGHTDKIGGAAWHPSATVGMSSDGLNFATGGGEGNVNLWSLDGYVLLHRSAQIVVEVGDADRI